MILLPFHRSVKLPKPLKAGALLLFIVVATPSFAQSSYKGLPLIKANSSKVNLRVGEAQVNGLWTIKPEYKVNSLGIEVLGQKEKLVIYTDVDSIAYEVRPDQAKQFYVLLNNRHYVLTEVKGFRNESTQSNDKFLNVEKPKSKTFGSLWEKHHVDDVVNGINDYADKASGAFKWVKDKVSGKD
ncbi:hypothetical protein [Pontibacter sp. SGAir0037]|uniref:hypothetical protein n=1 Tax=Pontibacter sp. SGAir0037 TaxID=2571030 RepID=UPI0010CD0D56|nr:hypothetical protein [Pontibacter sp. SGAir0037]QCR23596.1 hypothetical protein C1N53_15415 [Pontibacter sp. SGAir0037]